MCLRTVVRKDFPEDYAIEGYKVVERYEDALNGKANFRGPYFSGIIYQTGEVVREVAPGTIQIKNYSTNRLGTVVDTYPAGFHILRSYNDAKRYCAMMFHHAMEARDYVIIKVRLTHIVAEGVDGGSGSLTIVGQEMEVLGEVDEWGRLVAPEPVKTEPEERRLFFCSVDKPGVAMDDVRKQLESFQFKKGWWIADWDKKEET